MYLAIDHDHRRKGETAGAGFVRWVCTKALSRVHHCQKRKYPRDPVPVIELLCSIPTCTPLNAYLGYRGTGAATLILSQKPGTKDGIILRTIYS